MFAQGALAEQYANATTENISHYLHFFGDLAVYCSRAGTIQRLYVLRFSNSLQQQQPQTFLIRIESRRRNIDDSLPLNW